MGNITLAVPDNSSPPNILTIKGGRVSLIVDSEFSKKLEESKVKDNDVYMKIIKLTAYIEDKMKLKVNATLNNGIKSDEFVKNRVFKLVKLAYALSVIDKKWHDSLINLIKIRNDCAHSIKVNIVWDHLMGVVKAMPSGFKKEFDTRTDTLWGHYNWIIDEYKKEFSSLMKVT